MKRSLELVAFDWVVPGCKFCMQIMQISTSSSDDDCDFFIEAGGSFGLCSFSSCLFLKWLLSLSYAFFLLVLHIIILRPVSLKISDGFPWCEHSTFHWHTPPNGFFLQCTWRSIKYFSKFLEHVLYYVRYVRNFFGTLLCKCYVHIFMSLQKLHFLHF